MIILNAGVPRSGTVLVNAILRQLLQDVAPNMLQLNPNGGELPGLINRLVSTQEGKRRPCLIHTHSWSPEVAATVAAHSDTCVFVNYRDPRDVTVSLMKLHDHDLDTAAQLAEGSFIQMAHCLRDANPLAFPYELLIPGKELAIYRIAQHLGLRPSLSRIRRIDEATSIENHRSVMKRVQQGSLDTVVQRQNSKRILSEDKVTLINDRHIQSGAVGRWKDELSPAQQDVLNSRFAKIMAHFGYE